MGLFHKFKKDKASERVNEAAMLFCPESDCNKVLWQMEELFNMDGPWEQHHLAPGRYGDWFSGYFSGGRQR